MPNPPRPAEPGAGIAAHDRLYRSLRQQIMHGELAPGQALTLRGLAKAYGVSMTPAREAVRRLVAVELKLEHFQAGHKGQMELYLRWLDRYERQPTEEAPIGLILCASVNREEIEVLQLDGSSIRVAEYLTELPDREALRVKLHQAIELARNKAVVALPHAKDRGEEI